MNRFILNFTYFFTDFFYEHKRYYVFFGIIALCCFVLGIYLSVVDAEFLSVLKEDDNVLFDFINGAQSFKDVFFVKIKDVFLLCLLVFLFNLTFYTTFLNYFVVGYQSLLLGCTCCALVSLYSFKGVFCLIFLLPINLLIIFNLINFVAICETRAKHSHKYAIRFWESFGYKKYVLNFFVCFLVFVLICLLFAVIFLYLFKSFIFSVYWYIKKWY